MRGLKFLLNKKIPSEVKRLQLPPLINKAFNGKAVLTERELTLKLSHMPNFKTKKETRLVIKNAVEFGIIESKGPFGGRKLKKLSLF